MGGGSMPLMLEMLITRAGLLGVAAAWRSGVKSWMARKTATRLTSSTFEKASAGYSGNGALKLVPALLISTCTLPSFASILRMQVS